MTVSAQKPRDLSLDLARGLAVLLMIQTHAFHGWVLPSLQADPAFRLTRWLGAFPLPAFLLLAGMGTALRVHRASVDSESVRHVRHQLVVRGLSVVGWGYVVNGLWGAIDGARSVGSFLRADVLHAIGLSLCMVALAIGGRADGSVDTRQLTRRLIACASVIAGVTPWLTRLTRDVTGPLRYLVAPLSEVRSVTLMPVFPLAAWCALGGVVGLWLSSSPDPSSRQRRERSLGVFGALSWVVGEHVTVTLSACLGEPLSRASFALWPNVIEGAGRGLCLLWLGAGLARWLPRHAQHLIARFGAASLLIYAVHVPFCYGRLAGALRRSLSLTHAMPWVIALVVACYALVLVRDWIKARSRGVAVLRSSA